MRINILLRISYHNHCSSGVYMHPASLNTIGRYLSGSSSPHDANLDQKRHTAGLLPFPAARQHCVRIWFTGFPDPEAYHSSYSS